jgi:hypothetical protein
LNHDPRIYSKLILDKRITDNAFRLWHYLNDMAGPKRVCWPGVRRILADLTCHYQTFTHSLKLLQECEYVVVEKGNAHLSTRYHLSSLLKTPPVCKSEDTLSAKVKTPPVFKTAYRTYPNTNLTNEPKGNGLFKDKVPGAIRVQLNQELKENEARIKSLWSESMSAQDIAERKKLRARNSRIREELFIPL